jgi:hypothetical protein
VNRDVVWLGAIALGACFGIFTVGCGHKTKAPVPRAEAARPELADDVEQPLAAEVRAAWEETGAVSGWMAREESTPRSLHFRAGTDRGKPGELPAFRLTWWQVGIADDLPPPEQAFGLDLGDAEVTDMSLKELAGFGQLQALSISGRGVSDRGLKELTELYRLQWLSLDGTNVTDRGMDELARLGRLQWLAFPSARAPLASNHTYTIRVR